MGITPQDIQEQEFHVRFRGFDISEVDGFLDEVAAEFQQLLLEKRHLSERLQEQEKNNQEFVKQEQTFKNAIITAQKVADEMKAQSRREADELLTAARREADEIVAKAEAERAALDERIAGLRSLAARTGDDMRQTMRDYLQRLEEDFPPATVGGQLTGKPTAPKTSLGEAGAGDELFQKIEFDDLAGIGPRLTFNDSPAPAPGPAFSLGAGNNGQEPQND